MRRKSDYFNMKMSFDKVQQAFINRVITLEQFIDILIDNFGAKKTRKILRKNIELALKKEQTSLVDQNLP
jgi:hypothetical protein